MAEQGPTWVLVLHLVKQTSTAPNVKLYLDAYTNFKLIWASEIIVLESLFINITSLRAQADYLRSVGKLCLSVATIRRNLFTLLALV